MRNSQVEKAEAWYERYVLRVPKWSLCSAVEWSVLPIFIKRYWLLTLFGSSSLRLIVRIVVLCIFATGEPERLTGAAASPASASRSRGLRVTRAAPWSLTLLHIHGYFAF